MFLFLISLSFKYFILPSNLRKVTFKGKDLYIEEITL